MKFIKGAKINDRVCTCIRVIHPVPRRNFLFNVAQIFVDDELNVPVRYESYGWPKEAGGAPRVGRGVHLPEPEAEQRLHRGRLRHPQPEL